MPILVDKDLARTFKSLPLTSQVTNKSRSIKTANTDPRHEYELNIGPNIGFAKDKRVYLKFIKKFQENKAKALAEQALLVEIFLPKVRAEFITKVGDQETMVELNRVVKGFLASRQGGLLDVA